MTWRVEALVASLGSSRYNQVKGAICIDLLLQTLHEAPVIAAVRTTKQLHQACGSQARAVFLLSGDLFTLPALVQTARDAGKVPFVHMDLLDGVGRDAAGVRWIAKVARPYGVLSTRASMLKIAAEEGMRTILRMFLIDSSSVETGIRMAKASADLVEIMPGLVTRVIAKLCSHIDKPIIAGGMMERAIDVERALAAGAVAVSTSEQSLWMWKGREESG